MPPSGMLPDIQTRITLQQIQPLNESSEHWELGCELNGVWLLQHRQSSAANWDITDPERFKGCWRPKQQ